MKQSKKVPTHIGIIMDGNRRWAKKQGLSVVKGHKYVMERNIELLIEKCGQLGVEYLTLWAFSTENWQRDASEVNGLLKVFRQALVTKVQKFVERGARLRVIGDLSKFPQDIQDGIQHAIDISKKNTKITVTFALNYGGRDEIVRAAKKIVSRGDALSIESMNAAMDTSPMPDPDLIIRTGGDLRLSGFLTWQAVYAELYFTETLMPDFDPEQLEEAISEYARRQRRYGR